MKRLCITYHMRNLTESAETCITLSMLDEVADDVLAWGDDSRHVRQGGWIWQVLNAAAQMQGYALDCFVCAKEA